jgi:hypothetical protein
MLYSYAGMSNNNFKTVQLVSFLLFVREETFIKLECVYNTCMVMTLVGNTVILGWNVVLWKHMGQVTGKYVKLLCLLL